MSSAKEACADPRRILAVLFALTALNLVGVPLLLYFWQRDNNGPALTPDVDYRVSWVPDADFRGLGQTDRPEYSVPGGGKTYAAGETWRRLRPYYVSTPDGAWHMAVQARGAMTPYAVRTLLGVTAVPLVFSLFGLALCLRSRPADRRLVDLE